MEHNNIILYKLLLYRHLSATFKLHNIYMLCCHNVHPAVVQVLPGLPLILASGVFAHRAYVEGTSADVKANTARRESFVAT